MRAAGCGSAEVAAITRLFYRRPRQIPISAPNRAATSRPSAAVLLPFPSACAILPRVSALEVITGRLRVYRFLGSNKGWIFSRARRPDIM
jgi:hypothetical protein